MHSFALQLEGARSHSSTRSTVALRRDESVDVDRTIESKPVPKHHSALTIGDLNASQTTPLISDLGQLKNFTIEALSNEWQGLFRKKVPPNLPQYLMLRMIAYRLQANAFGDLDSNSIKYLNQVAAQRATRLASKNMRPRKAPPPIPAVPPEQSLKAGSILVREHAGHLYKVIAVAPRGFRWDNKTFKSLSEVAYAITGTKWNGPRFFGLRSESLIRDSTADEHSL